MNSVMGIRWNSLAGETKQRQQTQSQAQGDSNVRVDGSHNNVVIAPRQTQEQRHHQAAILTTESTASKIV